MPFPWSSAGPQMWFPTKRSPPPSPACLPPLQRLTSRSHLFYPSFWESGWPRHSQTAKQPVLQSQCQVQQAELGCPCWENDPVTGPSDKTSWGREGWEAERFTLTPLLLRDTFTFQRPENWKEGCSGAEQIWNINFQKYGQTLLPGSLAAREPHIEHRFPPKTQSKTAGTTDFYRNSSQNNYLSSGLLKIQISPIGRGQGFGLVRRAAAGGSSGRSKAEREQESQEPSPAGQSSSPAALHTCPLNHQSCSCCQHFWAQSLYMTMRFFALMTTSVCCPFRIRTVNFSNTCTDAFWAFCSPSLWPLCPCSSHDLVPSLSVVFQAGSLLHLLILAAYSPYQQCKEHRAQQHLDGTPDARNSFPGSLGRTAAWQTPLQAL